MRRQVPLITRLSLRLPNTLRTIYTISTNTIQTIYLHLQLQRGLNVGPGDLNPIVQLLVCAYQEWIWYCDWLDSIPTRSGSGTVTGWTQFQPGVDLVL